MSWVTLLEQPWRYAKYVHSGIPTVLQVLGTRRAQASVPSGALVSTTSARGPPLDWTLSHFLPPRFFNL